MPEFKPLQIYTCENTSRGITRGPRNSEDWSFLELQNTLRRRLWHRAWVHVQQNIYLPLLAFWFLLLQPLRHLQLCHCFPWLCQRQLRSYFPWYSCFLRKLRENLHYRTTSLPLFKTKMARAWSSVDHWLVGYAFSLALTRHFQWRENIRLFYKPRFSKFTSRPTEYSGAMKVTFNPIRRGVGE